MKANNFEQISFDLNDRKAIVNNLKHYGFAIVRNVLDKNHVKSLLDMNTDFMDYLYQELRKLPEDVDIQADFRAAILKNMEVQSGYPVSYDMQSYFDTPAKFNFHFTMLKKSGVLKVIADYLNDSIGFMGNYCSLRIQHPRELKKALPFHQDAIPASSSDGRGVVIWVPLTDIDRDTPTLEIIPEKIPKVLAHGGTSTSYAIVHDHDATIEKYKARLILDDLKAGDVLLFDFKTLHRTHVLAEMTKTRVSLDIRCITPKDLPRNFYGDYIIAEHLVKSTFLEKLNYLFNYFKMQYIVRPKRWAFYIARAIIRNIVRPKRWALVIRKILTKCYLLEDKSKKVL